MERSVVYAYDLPRKNFGKQPLFTLTQEVMLDSMDPDKAEQRKYVLRNPISRECQMYLPKSEHTINTERVEMKSRSVDHSEGGWPKDVHYNIEEETIRYRRRIEREDTYIHAITTLAPKFLKFIKQNNAVEIYEQYFQGMEETLSSEKPTAKLNNLYRDAEQRPVAGLCWTIEDDPKLVVTYCSKVYPVKEPVNKTFHCFIWDLENPFTPHGEFLPPTACWDIACSPVNPAILVGGLDDGRVCVFDVRARAQPVSISPPHTANRDPITGILYIQSRLNNEFFISSSDGQCKWFDIRDLSEPMETLTMSVDVPRGEEPTCSNAEGISSIQFDRALPTRFLAGTETGLVLNINRKGKTPQDVISGIYKAHKGPVRAVHRSPGITKMFLTCGDWTVHVWSDDIRTSPIITGKMHRYQLMDAVWAPERISGFMTVSEDGEFCYYDLLRNYNEPVVCMSVSKNPLLKIVPHADGRLVVMGDREGTVYLVSLSRDLIMSDSKDKPLMLQNYDRECRREQILAARVKEIRLKLRDIAEEETKDIEEDPDEEALIKIAEEEYRKAVIDEIRREGGRKR
uniref:Dynein intermediate chain 3, ciliary n=1 Tax=Heliothis virescens TaxID=7102 RepID=A0A2A4JLD2_HELVI